MLEKELDFLQSDGLITFTMTRPLRLLQLSWSRVERPQVECLDWWSDGRVRYRVDPSMAECSDEDALPGLDLRRVQVGDKCLFEHDPQSAPKSGGADEKGKWQQRQGNERKRRLSLVEVTCVFTHSKADPSKNDLEVQRRMDFWKRWGGWSCSWHTVPATNQLSIYGRCILGPSTGVSRRRILVRNFGA